MPKPRAQFSHSDETVEASPVKICRMHTGSKGLIVSKIPEILCFQDLGFHLELDGRDVYSPYNNSKINRVTYLSVMYARGAPVP